MTNVLIVDDEPQIRNVFKEILESEGFKVTEACDGNDALEKVAGKLPDFVLTDINMPNGMDGFTLIENLKKIKGQKTRPFIYVMSAYLNNEDRTNGGVDRYFKKPFDVFEVIEEMKDKASLADSL